MKNFVQPGETTPYTNAGAAISSGDAVVIGKLVGFAVVDIATDAEGEVSLEGVYSYAKEAPLAISKGDALFYDVANDRFTKTAAGNIFAGHAFKAADSADTSVQIKLSSSDGGESLQAASNVAAEATADGSDAATTQALANALKVKVNEILTALKASGLMAPDA